MLYKLSESRKSLLSKCNEMHSPKLVTYEHGMNEKRGITHKLEDSIKTITITKSKQKGIQKKLRREEKSNLRRAKSV